MDRSSNVTLPQDSPDFILTRHFAAPRSLVWTCWMDPSHLCRWWGPKTFACPVCEVDARPGGTFTIVMRGPDGTDYPMSGVFREIVPLRKIVKEDDTSGHPEEWHDAVDPDRRGQGKRKIEMITTITFEDDGDGTRVTIHTRFPSIRLRDNFGKIGMREGWSSSLDKLEEISDALKDSDREINVTRKVRVKVGRVFAAFSDPTGISNWWGPTGFRTTTYHMDFRPGGTWSFTMHGPDGTNYPNHVSYTSIETDRRIAYDHGTSAENPKMFQAVISFEPDGNETWMTLRLILADAGQRPHFVGFGAVEGAYDTLSRLDDHLSPQH